MPSTSPIAIPASECAGLAPLFSNTQLLPAVLQAALEGRLGQAWVMETAQPLSVRIDIGCYSIFGGAAAPGLLAGVQPPRDLVAHEPGWSELLRERFGSSVRDKPMQVFDPAALTPFTLGPLAERLPDSIQLVQMNEALAAQLGSELEPHGLQVFASPADLAHHGLGFLALDSGRVACAATSYTSFSRGIEVAVATHPGQRGRGLATATAARLLLECLAQERSPYWSASNPVSQRLALRLGYTYWGTCSQLELQPRVPSP